MMAKLTHDSEASPAGNRLDAQVSERFSDDCLHLAPEEPNFLWLLCTGFGQQRINRLLQLYKAHKVAIRKLLVCDIGDIFCNSYTFNFAFCLKLFLLISRKLLP